MDFSIVVPLYNEEANVDELHSSVTGALDKSDGNYELIFVDDGSSDSTVEKAKKIVSKDNRVKLIVFRRNFGQTAAMAAGFDNARGDVVIPMDGDLQNDPSDIPMMLKKIEEGYDVVSGWRKDRKDAFINRKLPSMLANGLISRITGVHLHDYGCTLKAYRREVLQNLNLYGEMHRFIPALASLAGAKVTEVPVSHHPRKHGVSKYGISRTFKVILDLITVKFLLSYSTKPIRLFGPLGFGAIFLSALSGMASLYMKLFDELSLNRNPLFLLSIITFFMGVQLVSLGLIAEINVRTYHESQNKRIYVIKETVGGQEES
ncbi:MAG: glycosyltransferase family 2 protein [Proteobacteria bacterium]|nr:glycosyltransferase family 2 protein [Pseudomonadota bacterium]